MRTCASWTASWSGRVIRIGLSCPLVALGRFFNRLRAAPRPRFVCRQDRRPCDTSFFIRQSDSALVFCPIRLRDSPALCTRTPRVAHNGHVWMANLLRPAGETIVPPLILTPGLDHLGKALGFVIYFQPTVLNLAFKPIHDPITALGNLFYVMAIYGAPWGMRGAF